MKTEYRGYKPDGTGERPPLPKGGLSSKTARKRELEKAAAALDRISFLSGNALRNSGKVYDDMKQPRYEDEYNSLMLCYGELAGIIKLIFETAENVRKELGQG